MPEGLFATPATASPAASITAASSPTNNMQLGQIPFQQALAEATPSAFITPALIALNAIVFLAMVVTGVSIFEPTVKEVLPWGANFWPLTASGQWWRLITACFLHFGIIHIGMNMFILLQVGIFTEKLFGNVRFLLLYLLAGVGGNIAGLYIHPMNVGAGASGAIFGVYGALLAFLLIERGVVPTANAIAIAKSAGIFLVYNLIYGLARPETDMVAHIGGFVTGMVAGGLLARPLAPGFRHIYPLRTTLVAIAGVALSVVAMARVPKVSPEQVDWVRVSMLAPSVTTATKDQVAYSGSVTRADADKLAQAMVKNGFFKKPGVLIVLARGPQGTVLSIPVRDDRKPLVVDGKLLPQPWETTDFLSSIQFIAMQAASILGGPPLTLRLVSGKGAPKKEIAINQAVVVVGQQYEMLYSNGATEAEATALGNALKNSRYSNFVGSMVFLSRSAGIPEIGFLVQDDAWNDPKTVAFFKEVGEKVAGSVGGRPIDVRLLDGSQQTRKVVHLP